MDIVIQKLVELWLYDIEVFSQAWIYWCLMIPFMFYFSFFIMKWTILTTPVWLPFIIIISSFRIHKKEN